MRKLHIYNQYVLKCLTCLDIKKMRALPWLFPASSCHWASIISPGPTFPNSMSACSVAQSCLTLCDHLDCSPPGSSVYGILQARILEWLPFPSPEDLPDPGIEPSSPESPALADGFFTIWATRHCPPQEIQSKKSCSPPCVLTPREVTTLYTQENPLLVVPGCVGFDARVDLCAHLWQRLAWFLSGEEEPSGPGGGSSSRSKADPRWVSPRFVYPQAGT